MTETSSAVSVSERLTQVQVDFLKVDVMLGQTFSDMALDTKDPEKRAWNRRAARKAYDTVRRFMNRVKLTDDEKRFLEENLLRLKCDLELLGEIF